MLKKLIGLGLAAFIGVGGALAYGYFHLQTWSNQAIKATEEQVVEFPSGTPLKALAADLHQRGLVSSPSKFEYLVRLKRNYGKFQAGKYKFEDQPTPAAIIDKMTSGDVYWPVIVEFTIPEGFTLTKVANRLAAKGIGHINELTTALWDENFAKELKIPSKNFEGYLYPATYSFVKIPSVPQVITHMVQTFRKNLPKNYEQRIKKMGLNLHQAVTFASLIELETLHDDEKSVISEVIWRRLKDKAPLAIDAALIYGIPDYQGDIKWRHLEDAKNPYNTRIHRGLPPTPIGAPGKASLAAVLTPTNTGAYYYVLLPNSDRHHFSKTLKEHNKYVRKLVEASKRGRAKSKRKKIAGGKE
jgi:UPF0755 protein